MLDKKNPKMKSLWDERKEYYILLQFHNACN